MKYWIAFQHSEIACSMLVKAQTISNVSSVAMERQNLHNLKYQLERTGVPSLTDKNIRRGKSKIATVCQLLNPLSIYRVYYPSWCMCVTALGKTTENSFRRKKK